MQVQETLIGLAKAEQSSKGAGGRLVRRSTLEISSDKDVTVPKTPPELMGESQGGTTIALALRTSRCLQPGPDLAPRASLIGISSLEADLTSLDGHPRVSYKLRRMGSGSARAWSGLGKAVPWVSASLGNSHAH